MYITSFSLKLFKKQLKMNLATRLTVTGRAFICLAWWYPMRTEYTARSFLVHQILLNCCALLYGYTPFRRPTFWLHDPCLKVTTVHGNKLLIVLGNDISTFNVFDYGGAVFGRDTNRLPSRQRRHSRGLYLIW